jgi:negative regulator of sigma E activity
MNGALMRSLVAVLILLTLACNKQDDDEKLQKSITSWRATLQLVADARLKNEVRDGFALKTIEEAVDDLEGQTAKTTNKDAARLIGIAGELRQAIERDDRAAIARARGELGQ